MSMYNKKCRSCGHRVGDDCILAGTSAFMENHYNRKCDRKHSGWIKRPSVLTMIKESAIMYFEPLASIFDGLKKLSMSILKVFYKE